MSSSSNGYFLLSLSAISITTETTIEIIMIMMLIIMMLLIMMMIIMMILIMMFI